MQPDQNAMKQACAEVAIRFFHAMDRRRYEAAAGLFHAGGVWIRQGIPLTGPAEISAALLARPDQLETRHLMSNIVVEGDLDQGELSYDLSVYARRGDAPPRLVQILSGTDQLSRIDGRWGILRKEAHPVFAFGL